MFFSAGSEGSVDVLEMALRMASEPQDTGTCSVYVSLINCIVCFLQRSTVIGHIASVNIISYSSFSLLIWISNYCLQ